MGISASIGMRVITTLKTRISVNFCWKEEPLAGMRNQEGKGDLGWATYRNRGGFAELCMQGAMDICMRCGRWNRTEAGDTLLMKLSPREGTGGNSRERYNLEDFPVRFLEGFVDLSIYLFSMYGIYLPRSIYFVSLTRTNFVTGIW